MTARNTPRSVRRLLAGRMSDGTPSDADQCATVIGKPRSTPHRACFVASPDPTPTSVAREVTLYLAVPSPSSSSPLCSGSHHALVVGPPAGPIRVRRRHASKSRSGSMNGSTIYAPRGQSSIVWPVVSR
jgi:hypothetical protein